MSNMNNENPDLFVNIVGKAQRKNELDAMRAVYYNSASNSINKQRIRYGDKKKKKITLVQRAALYILILSVLLGTVALANASTDYFANAIEDKAAYDSYSDAIDKKIDDYLAKMNYNGYDGDRIENAHSYNEEGKEAFVSYNPGVLMEYIVDNMNVSEVETRCAILAAYKIINGPYRNEVFNKVFSTLSKDKEYEGNLPDYLNVNTFDEYIKALGYESVEDYHKNERENIKKLSIQEHLDISYVGEDNGRKRI